MLRLVICLLCLELTIAFDCTAGGEYRVTGARSAGMGHSSVTLTDLWSSFNNQAALARLESTVAGIYYENRFNLRELSYKAAACAIPMHSGTLALSVSHYGFELWNESKGGIAYGRSFGKYLCAGMQLDFIRIHQQESYGNIGFVTFEVSALSQLTPSFAIGAHLYNPISVSVSKVTDERAPACFRVGASYKASNRFLITAEAGSSSDNEVNLSAGIEAELTSAVFLRTGISTNPAMWSFGVGVNYKALTIDISTAYHAVLGFSPQSSLICHF